MLEHLLDPSFQDIEAATATELLSAQATTATLLLANMGSPEHILDEDAKQRARSAFAAVTNPNVPDAAAKAEVQRLKTPHAVKHLAGMLSQYDWEYVEQAKEIRGYVVAKLLEETKSPEARHRLKALELVGKLTEVGSFTEKIEVKKTILTDTELEMKIKDKLNRFMGVIDVVDAETKPDEVSTP